eukprot:scaffold183750_cov19-Tisochrysis_lutea.AAC.1
MAHFSQERISAMQPSIASLLMLPWPRFSQDRISAMQLARSKAIAAEQLPEEDQENSSQKPEELLVYTIYAAMPHEQQLRAFEPAPPGARK